MKYVMNGELLKSPHGGAAGFRFQSPDHALPTCLCPDNWKKKNPITIQ